MRIDDDSAERAQAEARAADKKLQQQQQKRKVDEVTAFDKAMQSRSSGGAQQKSYGDTAKAAARSAIQQLTQARKDVSVEGKMEGRLEKVEVEALADTHHHEELQGDQAKLQRGAAGRKDVDRKTGRMIESGRGDDQQVNTGQAGRAHEAQAQGETKQAVRSSDAKADARQQENRDDRKDGKAPGSPPPQGKVTARKDQGDTGQGGGQNSGGQPGAFRMPPPGLMAPPPVVRPKETPQVSRARALAQEIAEKIVKHARVGVNKLGLPEFQLELKSDILKGLKVKVSGRHGRIRATFASRDPAVCKQLRGEVEGLRQALLAKGLKVDALEIEEERA